MARFALPGDIAFSGMHHLEAEQAERIGAVLALRFRRGAR
jgi:hypothetical protein